MSRLILAACCFVLFSLPLAAFAQSPTYPPPQPSVAAGGGQADGTAFTGDDLTTPVWLGAALLLAGGSAVYVARRRAQRLTG